MKARLAIVLAMVFVLAACSAAHAADPLPPAEIQMAEVTVYFLDEAKFATGTEPYEVGVIREIHPDGNLPFLALQAYFSGPTEEEKSSGLAQVLSGCTGFSDLTIQDGIARVYLTGPCTSGGSTYTIAGPVMKTLRQFDDIDFVKLYDSDGVTEIPEGPSDSIPFVLEP